MRHPVADILATVPRTIELMRCGRFQGTALEAYASVYGVALVRKMGLVPVYDAATDGADIVLPTRAAMMRVIVVTAGLALSG
jgi:hypothetical protein